MIRVVAIVLVAITLAGCSTSMHQTFPSADRSHLWTAMVATAKAPEYTSDDILSRWIVVENNVDANPEKAQIDVRRKITRTLHLPRQKEQHDRRDVHFSVFLLPSNPPTIEFISKNIDLIPARGENEAKRYFSAVEEMLVPIK
jgi:hypothetical protein